MNESTSTESSRSRWFTRISISLAVIAALVVLVTVGGLVTVYVVTEKYESLHHAAGKGDLFAVQCFLLRGADVDARSSILGLTPLHIAAENGHTGMSKLLIEKGADVNGKNKHGKTPLHYAAGNGNAAVAELLIEKGADVNAKDKDGKTPLAIAIKAGHEEVANLLHNHGAKE